MACEVKARMQGRVWGWGEGIIATYLIKEVRMSWWKDDGDALNSLRGLLKSMICNPSI